MDEKFMDKYTDRNIANFKSTFSPTNGKFQVEWQCTLRTPQKRGSVPSSPRVRRAKLLE